MYGKAQEAWGGFCQKKRPCNQFSLRSSRREIITGSALLYIMVNRECRSVAVSNDSVSEDHILIEAISGELKETDRCTVLRSGIIVVTLRNTTESEAMQLARLTRSAFQRNNFSNKPASISISVLIHDFHADERIQDLLTIAQASMNSKSKQAGNTIECLVLSS